LCSPLQSKLSASVYKKSSAENVINNTFNHPLGSFKVSSILKDDGKNSFYILII
jgi:hypothetical protein